MKEKELEDICNKTSIIDCMLECHFESECEEYYHKHGVIPCEGKENKESALVGGRRTDGQHKEDS